MNIKELPEDTRELIRSLILTIKEILNERSSPHTSVVSDSRSFPDEDIEITMHGGSIRAPGRPPFRYDRRQISELHRNILRSSKGELCCLIVKAERKDIHSEWTMGVKLVSKNEHLSITGERQAIDERVKHELETINGENEYDRVSYGKDMPNKIPVVVRAGSSGVEKSEPSAVVLGLLEEAVELYKNHQLDLQIAYWTLLDGEIEFREYFE